MLNHQIDHIKTEFNRLWNKGFYHIFGSAFINKVIQFAASILLVRILSKQLYGVWSYAENILQFFLLIQGLGCVVGFLQFSSATNDQNKKMSYFKFTLILGVLTNSLIAIAIMVFAYFGSLPIKGSLTVLSYLFLFPVFSIIFDSIQMYFRSSFENQKFAYLTTVNSATFLIFSIIGAYYWGLPGVALGRYSAVLISIIFGGFFLKHTLKLFFNAPNLLKSEIKEFMSFSLISMLSNIFSSLLFLLDVFFIGYLLKDELMVASYKIATIIPFAMNFLPMTIIIYVYPYIVQLAHDKEKIKLKVNQLMKILLIVNSLISLFCIVFAELIIKIVFGSRFIDAVPAFRILMISYIIIGSFRSPLGNTLNALKKVNYNLIVVIVTGILNIVLDYILISNYKMIGAALTSLSVSALSVMMSYSFYNYTLKKK